MPPYDLYGRYESLYITVLLMSTLGDERSNVPFSWRGP